VEHAQGEGTTDWAVHPILNCEHPEVREVWPFSQFLREPYSRLPLDLFESGQKYNALSYMHHGYVSDTGREVPPRTLRSDSALLLPLVGKALLLAQVLFLLVDVASVGSGVLLLTSKRALFILPARAQYLVACVEKIRRASQETEETHAGSFLSDALDAIRHRFGCLLDARCPRRDWVLTADRLGLLAFPHEEGVSPVCTLRARFGRGLLTSPTPSPELYRRADVDRAAFEDRIGAMRRERWGGKMLEDDCRGTARTTDWKRSILASLVREGLLYRRLCSRGERRESSDSTKNESAERAMTQRRLAPQIAARPE
jgi:hypothetical protein